MKRNIICTLIFTGLIMLTTAAGAQSIVKDTRDLKGFSRIGYGISGDLKIKFGPEFSVVLEGDKDDVEEVVTVISNGRLQIKVENWRFDFRQKVNVYITMPGLDGLSVSGSGRAEILDEITDADNLDLSVSGSGRLLAAGITTDELECSVSGSGNIEIGSRGSADRANITISGSGSFTGEDFEADHLEVSVSGSGNCLCRAGDSLDASISGSGNIRYFGDPKINARVSGSGHVRSAE